MPVYMLIGVAVGMIEAEQWRNFIHHNGPMPMMEPRVGYRIVRSFKESIERARKDVDKAHAALISLPSSAPTELHDEFNKAKSDALVKARILEAAFYEALAPELGIHEVKVPTDGNT